MPFSVGEHFTKTAHHATFYLACGPETGQLIIFVHGSREGPRVRIRFPPARIP
jgi:hypothetical protein